MTFPKSFAKTLPQKLRPRASYLILLTLPLAILIYSLPRLYDDYRYPHCGHIVLITARHHSGPWFTSGTEGCTLNERTPWYGSNDTVKDVLSSASSTSLRILPEAFQAHGGNIRTFFRYAKANGIKVFMLKIQGIDSWNHVRKNMDDNLETKYKELVGNFFRDCKKMLREVGLEWDEYSFEDVAQTRMINGVKNECYIRNCNV